MRVQPHLPSRPFTATVIESPGAAWWACSAAKSPAPPEPRIRTSVSSRLGSVFTFLQPLHRHDNHHEGEADRVEERLGIDEQEAGGDEHHALYHAGALE